MSVQALQQELEQCLRRSAAGDALLLARQLAALKAPAPWMQIAKACHDAGDAAGEEEALNRRLAEQRGDLGAISALAELKRHQGDRRAAESFYRLGMNTVAQMQSPPAPVAAWAERAQAYLAEGSAAYAEHMAGHLASAGILIADTSPQMQEAFRLLTGQVTLYLQQPSMFFYPGLAHRAWFEREEFAWVKDVESHTGAIRAELEQLVAGATPAFEPYVTGQPGRPKPNNPLLDDPRWGAAYLWKNGELQQDLAAHVPSALKALEAAPMPMVPERAPMALFSRLKPGTHIKPHHGMLNTRLICHLPLIVPEGCALRVGAETRAWQAGELLIFDDSIEHEAWNRGSADRTVLLFEIWRPEIPLEDRLVLTTLFGAISKFGENA
ncbi:MAG: aspartyl/asparaginyl beta-hydroxylase domain-containing protein [Alphaproteobacteria bacterium]|nr:MAG: aspartyl/asparaginyl beta-hydroxylase domain-containing protein [Alphaproteobacteria bacterium]